MPSTILPVRKLGEVGVISDQHPYDLQPNALSAGVNVRFENGKIMRAPVMRRVHEYTALSPAYVFSIPPVASGYEGVVAVSNDLSKITQVVGYTESDLTPLTPPAAIAADEQFTSTFLGNIAYLNRFTHVPLYKAPADARFAELPGWDASWRAQSLRSYKDFLLALNVTKGAVEYPTMVKWPDIATFGTVPVDWDHTSTTNSAGEVIINEMRDPIVDGLSLRDSFILYGTSEVWQMDYIGGQYLFRFRKIYDSVGIMGRNCVLQIDGLHYVFDRSDIYVHDGATKRSIIHGRNKEFVFGGLNYKHAKLCFVAHDPRANEIYFCYVSSDRLVGFPGATTGCNRAAVYNYRRDTWTFHDLPNVTGGCLSQVATGHSYASIAGDVTYETIGGTFMANEDDRDYHALWTSRADLALGITADRLLGSDIITGGRLLKPVEPEAMKPAFAERTGIDLDEIGADLTLYKAIQGVYPQLGVQGASSVEFQFGASDVVGSEPQWSAWMTYDPTTENKLDLREAGRYLGWRIRHTGTTDFAFSGFDTRVVLRGRR